MAVREDHKLKKVSEVVIEIKIITTQDASDVPDGGGGCL